MTELIQDKMKEIYELMNRTEGTLELVGTLDDLLNPDIQGQVIFQIISGAQIYKVVRDHKMRMVYYYSSPGTGTWVATLELEKLIQAPSYYWGITWSPTGTSLFIGPQVEGAEVLFANGVKSSMQLRIGRDGSIFQVGDEGVEVMNVRVQSSGQDILLPTAIEAWRGIITGTNILNTGTSEEGYIFDVVISNLIISTLVTGFETYCKTRLIELEQEGIRPNMDALINRVFSNYEREAGEPNIVKQVAESNGQTFLQKIAQIKINFQSYDECKRAFNKAYDIKFSDIGLMPEELQFLQRLIKFRHKIVHVSPLTGMVNQDRVPPEEPEFSNKLLAKKAIGCFDKFIYTLHEATLKLRRID